MRKRIVARWQDWSGKSLEHIVVQEDGEKIVAEALILATAGDDNFAVNYSILCDTAWRVTKVRINQIGDDRTVELASDGGGNWIDGSATPQPHLAGAIDIDISITPFTNTLPIRRLGLHAGQSAEILAVYIQLPGLAVTTDRQRYRCLTPRIYRYESLDSEFSRDIEIDDDGLVVTYPGLFRRVL
jgi:hypothetical protein